EISLRYFTALDLAVRVARTALALCRGRLRARDLALRFGLRLRFALVGRARGVRLRPNAAGCRFGVGMDAARTSAVRDAGIVTAVVATTMASAVTAPLWPPPCPPPPPPLATAMEGARRSARTATRVRQICIGTPTSA